MSRSHSFRPVVVAFLLGALPGQEPQDPLPPADPAVTAADLRHHVEFLASDELRGREAGTPDAVRAARYLARALDRSGLAPGVPEGFLQPVPLVRRVISAPPELVLTTSQGETVNARYGADFALSGRGEPRSTPKLSLRVVRSLEELPAETDAGTALLLDGSSRERREWFAARGQAEGAGWGLELRSGPRTEGKPRAAGSSSLRPRAEASAGTPEVVTLRGPLLERALAGEFAALSLTVSSERQELVDYNVVGLLRGVGTAAHPELADEAIVISAHYDHLGVREGGADEDVIYNGADDDASGTAAVLELAEALAARGAPARTVVFLLAAGEEQGLLGTRHYLEHPAVPLERTLLNLNFEMIGRPDALVGGPGHLWLTGDEHTSLGAALRAADHPVVKDPRPEQDFYRRSDNYAFVQRGVMGQTLSSYDMHQDYHRPSDEAETLDYAHLETVVRTASAVASLLADGEVTPAWTSTPADAAAPSAPPEEPPKTGGG